MKAMLFSKGKSLTIPSNWAKDAACQDPEIGVDFYSNKPAEQKKARALCNECPIRFACLQFAMDTEERWGVWGGTTDIERRKNLAIDSFGNSHVSTQGKIRCGYCGPLSSRYIEVLDRKRMKSHLRCTNCGLKWRPKKRVNERMSNL